MKFLTYDISEALKKFASFGRSLPRRNSYKEYLEAHPRFVVAYPDSQTSEVVHGPFGERRMDRELPRTSVNQVSILAGNEAGLKLNSVLFYNSL